MTTETTAPKSDHTYQGTADNSEALCAGILDEDGATDSSVDATIKFKVAQRQQKIETRPRKDQTTAPYG